MHSRIQVKEIKVLYTNRSVSNIIVLKMNVLCTFVTTYLYHARHNDIILCHTMSYHRNITCTCFCFTVSSSFRRAELLAAAQKLRKSDDKYIVRSRNPVIDAWQSEKLLGESAQERGVVDAYADLEDFIVYDEEEITQLPGKFDGQKRRRVG